MSQIPHDLQYTKEHEWVAPTSTPLRIRMGITDYAQAALGDIVYVQMPKVGETVTAAKVCGGVESTTSVTESVAPVSGTIAAVNGDLDGAPELINSDPYGSGWLVEIEVPSEPTGLLSAAQYGEITA